MGTDTSELHIVIYRTDGEVQLHAKYEFTVIPFDCTLVDWTAMTIVYNNPDGVDFVGECDWTGVGIEFKFGGECDVSGSEPTEVLCCEGTTLPASLVLNGTLNGSQVWFDEALDTTSPAAGYRYDTATGDVLNCDFGGGDPPTNWAEFVVASEGAMALVVHSCDPYHATGSAVFGANTYSVEITE